MVISAKELLLVRVLRFYNSIIVNYELFFAQLGSSDTSSFRNVSMKLLIVSYYMCHIEKVILSRGCRDTLRIPLALLLERWMGEVSCVDGEITFICDL